MNDLYYDGPLFSIERCPACEEDEHPVYLVRAKLEGLAVTIGALKWAPQVSEYCLYPRPKTAWNWDVLFHVLNFQVDALTAKVLDEATGPAS